MSLRVFACETTRNECRSGISMKNWSRKYFQNLWTPLGLEGSLREYRPLFFRLYSVAWTIVTLFSRRKLYQGIMRSSGSDSGGRSMVFAVLKNPPGPDRVHQILLIPTAHVEPNYQFFATKWDHCIIFDR